MAGWLLICSCAPVDSVYFYCVSRRRRGSTFKQQLHTKNHHQCWNVCPLWQHLQHRCPEKHSSPSKKKKCTGRTFDNIPTCLHHRAMPAQASHHNPSPYCCSPSLMGGSTDAATVDVSQSAATTAPRLFATLQRGPLLDSSCVCFTIPVGPLPDLRSCARWSKYASPLSLASLIFQSVLTLLLPPITTLSTLLQPVLDGRNRQNAATMGNKTDSKSKTRPKTRRPSLVLFPC